ncbi:hypothetical protein ACFC0X_24910 [Paenibacillus chitinolyticus]|uniref:hypothetical protein n=1 Tax=Paenibacillus chitinolyticus TaxID=79263 RepID=UPI0035D5D295
MSESVTVKYKAEQIYCGCCNQKLPIPKISKERNFTISKDGALNWTNWDEVVEYQEDLESMVPEFVYETIRFYAVDHDERVIVEGSEIEKVKGFLLREFSAKHDEQV